MNEMMKRYYRAKGMLVPDNDNTTPAMQRVVQEQAAYYNMEPATFARFMDGMACLQEIAETDA